MDKLKEQMDLEDNSYNYYLAGKPKPTAPKNGKQQS